MNANKKHNPKHSNQVRIIGGDLRGRKIPFISADGLRPTPDSVRERLFNWLGQDLTGQHTLDPFAGSGVLSFEAISRHAQSATLCDNSSPSTSSSISPAKSTSTNKTPSATCAPPSSNTTPYS